VHAEVLGDLLDGHTGVTAAGDPHDVVTELSGIGLCRGGILPASLNGKPPQVSPVGAADPIE